MVISSTDLKPGKSTSGHSHSGQEEVYNFVKGKGIMKIDEETFNVEEGDIYMTIVLIFWFIQEIFNILKNLNWNIYI